MKVIHPGLFLILQRFPNHREALRQLYRESKSFQSTCYQYQKCSEAIHYWAKSEKPEGPDRQQEYLMLLHELEIEVLNSLTERP